MYPVACSPQAWAVGAVFMVLQACLGLSLNQPEGRIVFDHPRLPSFIEWITIKGLRIGSASVDLSLRRDQEDVGIFIERREADLEREMGRRGEEGKGEPTPPAGSGSRRPSGAAHWVV